MKLKELLPFLKKYIESPLSPILGFGQRKRTDALGKLIEPQRQGLAERSSFLSFLPIPLPSLACNNKNASMTSLLAFTNKILNLGNGLR
jgi:hypothetical protein